MDCLCGKRIDGRDEVGEFRGSRAPAHSQGALVTAAVGATVRAETVRTRILADDGQELGLLERKGAVVLEEDGGFGGRVPDEPAVLLLHVDVEVDLLPALLRPEVAVPEGVLGPRIHVDTGLVYSKPDLEVRGHNSHGHVVDTVLRHCAIENSDRQVGAPKAISRVEEGVTRHGHVKTSKCAAITLPNQHRRT